MQYGNLLRAGTFQRIVYVFEYKLKGKYRPGAVVRARFRACAARRSTRETRSLAAANFLSLAWRAVAAGRK